MKNGITVITEAIRIIKIAACLAFMSFQVFYYYVAVAE